MLYHPDHHHRHSYRLQGYDYSAPGAYFITLCAYQRQCLFGSIIDGQMQPNDLGQIVAEEWQKSSEIRQEIELDEWVLMPNHFHGIVWITPPDSPTGVGAKGPSPLRQREHPHPPRVEKTGIMPLMKSRSLSSLVAGFKTITTKRINQLRNAPGTPVWQRNYYDHIIRHKDALQKIRQYVQTNPQKWQIDQLHPEIPSKW